jgi:hypothetical protein
MFNIVTGTTKTKKGRLLTKEDKEALNTYQVRGNGGKEGRHVEGDEFRLTFVVVENFGYR